MSMVRPIILPYRAASMVGTCPAAEYSRIAASAVTSAAVRCRAVAIRNRSAGSAWNSPGRRTLSNAIAGSIGHRSIPGEPSALSIQTPTSIASCNRPLSTRSAISQGVMAETPTRPVRRSSSILALASGPIRGESATAQTSAWVSRMITSRRTSPQPVPPARRDRHISARCRACCR